MKTENISPHIGTVVHSDRSSLCEEENVQRCLELLEQRDVLVFPRVGLNDEEQLAFTDKLGQRVDFTHRIPVRDATQGIYTVTLDPKLNPEPEYVLGTYFWHMDGLTVPIAPPKASVLSARSVAPKGGQTEFASSCAAYAGLSNEERSDLEGLRVVHSVTAAVRAVAAPDSLEINKRQLSNEHPLVWHRRSGRSTMLIGYSADYVVGMPQAEGRALLARLLEWTAQPAFTYRHHWQVGDLVVWDNTSALHRVVPYAADSGRRMHRTSVGGVENANGQ